jgi:hypothetical protein
MWLPPRETFSCMLTESNNANPRKIYLAKYVEPCCVFIVVLAISIYLNMNFWTVLEKD